MDYLSELPVDLFMQQITYLPYTSIVAVCSTNRKLHSYCSSSNPRWKSLIFSTFENLEHFRPTLQKIQQQLFEGEDLYDYRVYAQLQSQLLDKVTLGMIFYRQGDIENFNELLMK